MRSSQSLIVSAVVLSTLVFGGSQAQTLTGTFQCKSIIIGTAQGPNSLSVSFTTPSTITSRNPQLPFNGEFMSSDDPAVQFLLYWVLFNGGGPKAVPAREKIAKARAAWYGQPFLLPHRLKP